MYVFWFFFFFRAEDGIRDADVTGVQTCALPISPASRHAHVLGAVFRRNAAPVKPVVEAGDGFPQLPDAGDGRVLLVINVDRDAVDTVGRARQRSRLGLARSEEHTSELQS